MLKLDMIAVLVPATWNVPGAGRIPTARNKGNAEGRLEPVPVDVGELVTAGMKVPGSLFEAEGVNGAGGHIGVRVGVYDSLGAESGKPGPRSGGPADAERRGELDAHCHRQGCANAPKLG